MSNFWKSVRVSFFAGLLVIVPVAASVGLLWWLFNTFTNLLLPGMLRDELQKLPYPDILFRLIALLLFGAVVTLVGWVTRLVVGKRLVRLVEGILQRVPLLNKIYPFMKEVSHTVLAGQKTMFQRVVLVQYPRAGVYSIGFLTNDNAGEAGAKTGRNVVNVFFPTTPNPTSGFLTLVPREQVTDLDMSVADGMKMVISGGTVVPPLKTK
jgi:uncharacterized membrane protein